MKVLFVSSGNSEFFDISPFIKSQGESLSRSGIEMDYFTIKGKGFSGYRKNISRLKEYIKSTKPDIVHSHYSLTGWVSVMAKTGKPMVLSLMGTDTHGGVAGESKTTASTKLTKLQVKFIQFFYPALIVKSENLRKSVWKKNACYVIPNGVNYEKFKPMDKISCRKKLDLSLNDKLVLFMGDTSDKNKNFDLLEKAKPFILTKDVQIIAPYPVPHEKVPLYFNACDVLVFPSYKEGSPNVIKEALACNTRIVATDSGDILERVTGLSSVLISDFDEKDMAAKIDQMLTDKLEEDTREIVRSQIDEKLIAGKIVSIYNKLIDSGK